MSPIRVEQVRTLEQLQSALFVRRRVFIEEQGVPEELEVDEHDADPATLRTAIHVLGTIDGEPVATGRLILRADDGRPHIGRVAVLPQYRRKGNGRAVMQALHELARQHGAQEVTLAAQLHAIGFYERLGYVARGDVFLDAGIEHRWMDLALQ